jgi:hypothetical protein
VEGRISALEDTIDTKIKTKFLDKDSRAAKGILKNSAIPSKDKICKSWALKEKRYKPKEYLIYSTK